MTDLKEHERIWFPGHYGGSPDEEYAQRSTDISEEKLIELVQRRAKEDGEWAIKNEHVGNEELMRKMMAWASDPKIIIQCYGVHLDTAPTVDWICRHLAVAAMRIGGVRD